MKNLASFGLLAIGCLLGACGKSETPPPVAPDPQQAPPQQYPAQQQQYPAQQQQYPAQQQYPQQAAPAAPMGAASPAPAGATGGQMATPGPLALPCQNDAACGFARCNVQFQKCAFPCLTQVDCAPGNACNTMTGLCLPGAPH